jgi:single-strand selective monofunctional uracil DNA glycosylase
MVPVFEACDAHLARVIRAVRPDRVIGVGAWAEKCARRVVREHALKVPVGRVLHPSPASPAANRGWAEQARRQLAAQGHPILRGAPEGR